MAFEASAGIARIFGPPIGKRPYTRTPVRPPGPKEASSTGVAVRRGTTTIRPPGQQDPNAGAPVAVATPPPAQAAAGPPAPAAPPGTIADKLIAHISTIQDP